MKNTLAKLTLLAAVLIGACYAQAPDQYSVSASTTAVTIQQPATGGAQVQGSQVSIYCAAAQTATPSWNGTAATATAGTIKNSPSTINAPRLTAWTGSNVGAGTSGTVYNVPAGSERIFDISDVFLGNTGTASNYTWTTNGTCTISISWIERK